MIQDIRPGLYHNEYRPLPPRDGDAVCIFRAGQVLCREDEELRLPRVAELSSRENMIFLFRMGEESWFLGPDDAEIPGYDWKPVSVFREARPKETAFGMITAHHLATWYSRARYCGACGTKTVPDGKERMMRCPACGNMIFPTIAPAVIVGVVNGDRILLTKYKGRPGPPRALIAGFCEIGEALEDTVRREVMEEAGLRVGKITYYKSQPWALSGSLLSGFYAELEGDDAITMQEDELGEAVWVDRRDMGEMDDGISLTREMIEHFRLNGFR